MERPTGSGQVIGGWVLAIVGFLALLIGVFQDTRGYNGVDVSALATQWMLFYFGGAAIALGGLLVITGWIIQAISFLPGKGDATFSASQSLVEPKGGDATEVSPRDENPSALAWVLIVGGIVVALVVIFILTS